MHTSNEHISLLAAFYCNNCKNSWSIPELFYAARLPSLVCTKSRERLKTTHSLIDGQISQIQHRVVLRVSGQWLVIAKLVDVLPLPTAAAEVAETRGFPAEVRSLLQWTRRTKRVLQVRVHLNLMKKIFHFNLCMFMSFIYCLLKTLKKTKYVQKVCHTFSYCNFLFFKYSIVLYLVLKLDLFQRYFQ